MRLVPWQDSSYLTTEKHCNIHRWTYPASHGSNWPRPTHAAAIWPWGEPAAAPVPSALSPFPTPLPPASAGTITAVTARRDLPGTVVTDDDHCLAAAAPALAPAAAAASDSLATMPPVAEAALPTSLQSRVLGAGRGVEARAAGAGAVGRAAGGAAEAGAAGRGSSSSLFFTRVKRGRGGDKAGGTTPAASTVVGAPPACADPPVSSGPVAAAAGGGGAAASLPSSDGQVGESTKMPEWAMAAAVLPSTAGKGAQCDKRCWLLPPHCPPPPSEPPSHTGCRRRCCHHRLQAPPSHTGRRTLYLHHLQAPAPVLWPPRRSPCTWPVSGQRAA